MYSKTCLKQPLKKKTKIGFQDRLSLNAGQKYCRMVPLEHSAILSTFIKLPFVINIVVLSIFEWPLKTGFTLIIIGINGSLQPVLYMHSFTSTSGRMLEVILSCGMRFPTIRRFDKCRLRRACAASF